MKFLAVALWSLAVWSLVLAWVAVTDGPLRLAVMVTPLATSALLLGLLAALELLVWARARVRRVS